MCYHQVYSAQDAQCLSAVWLHGQNCARLVGVPGEDPRPAIPWEVASPHSPAVLRPVRSRQGLPLSRLYPSLGYPFIHPAWGLDLCAPPSVSFLGQFRTCAEPPRPGLGTLPPVAPLPHASGPRRVWVADPSPRRPACQPTHPAGLICIFISWAGMRIASSLGGGVSFTRGLFLPFLHGKCPAPLHRSPQPPESLVLEGLW